MTTQTLRANLMQTMTDLASGKITTKEANAHTKSASAINQSLRFDIENKRENIRLMKATAKNKYKDLKATALEL